MVEFEIIQPDDWHLHLRDGDLLESVILPTSLQYGRALVMPNLTPPVSTVDMAIAYRLRILSALQGRINQAELNNQCIGLDRARHFEPLMTLYLTPNLSTEEIKRVAETPEILGVKFYPKGATTNSESGSSSLEKFYPIFEKMAELGVRLCIHGEDVDVTTDVFSREEKFIEKSLAPLMKQIPELQVVFEHVSTSEAVDFVTQNKNMAATVTPQHLIFNRNHLLAGRLYPHRYCAPLLKKESDRKALVKAVTQDFNEKFFLGTDSAPHLRNEKESSCGCAGCFSSPHALAKYIEIFELEGKLGNLEKFSSINGAKFYNLSLNSRKISLKREKWLAEEKFFTNKSQQIVSFVQDEVLTWKINY